jgi:hypothetical protein
MQQVGKQKTRRPVPECRKSSRFRARKAAPFLCRGLFSKPPDAKRRTQYFLLSDLPHRWIYFDYDQGPLSCVHLPVFVNSAAAAPAPGAALAIFFFIIAPQKNGVNPKAKFCKDFYGVLQKQNTLLRVAAHREGCFAWILPWCEEESCYLGSGCGPTSHGKSITAFTIHFVKKL